MYSGRVEVLSKDSTILTSAPAAVWPKAGSADSVTKSASAGARNKFLREVVRMKIHNP